MRTINTLALLLVIVGALNWGTIGAFKVDLVRSIFGDMTLITRIVYLLVGVAALQQLYFFVKPSMK